MKTANNHRWGWRRKLTAMLAGLVVFSTTYGLVLPALTLDEGTIANEPGINMETQSEVKQLAADVTSRVDVASWSGLTEDGTLEMAWLSTDLEEADQKVVAMRDALGDLPLRDAFVLSLSSGEITDPEVGVEVTLYPYTVENINRLSLYQFADDGTFRALPYEADAKEHTVTFIAKELGSFAFGAPEPVDIIGHEGLSKDAELTLTRFDLEKKDNSERASAMQGALKELSLNDAYTLELMSGEILDEEAGATVTLKPYRVNDNTHIYLFAEDGTKEELAFEADEEAWSVEVHVKGFGTLAFCEMKEEGEPEEPAATPYALSGTGLSEDARLEMLHLTRNDENYGTYAEALTQQMGDVEIFDIFEINLTSGTFLSEDGAVITLTNYQVTDPEKVALYHITADNVVEELAYTAQENVVIFTTTSFSPFIFATKSEKTDSADPVDPEDSVVDIPEEPKTPERPVKAPLRADSVELDKFVAEFVSGAEKKDNGDLVWTPADPAKDHAFKYVVRYVLSGKFEYEAGGIQILVPITVLKDRNGNQADQYEMSLPLYNPDGENNSLFVYDVYVDGNGDTYLRIFNCRKTSAAEAGFFEVTYLTTEKTYQYKDYDNDPNTTNDASTPFNAIIDLTYSEKGKEGTETHHDEKTAPPVYIDTDARVKATFKDKVGKDRTFYNTWQDSWGTACKPANPDNYFYIVWEIRTVIVGTTQIYDFSLVDSLEDSYYITENGVKRAAAAGVCGYKMQGSGSSFYTPNGVVTGLKTDFPGGRYDYVLTFHEKSELFNVEGNTGAYDATNHVAATVKPHDWLNDETKWSTVYAARKWHYDWTMFNAPYGQFWMGKWGLDNADRYTSDPDDIRRYDMAKLVDKNNNFVLKEDGINKLAFYTYLEGYSYLYTKDDNYVTDKEQEKYGHIPVTFTLTDDEFYLKWVGEKDSDLENTNYPGYVKLAPEDYRIDYLQVNGSFKRAVYDETAREFIGENLSAGTYGSESDVVDVYAKFAGENPAGTDISALPYEKVATVTFSASGKQYAVTDTQGRVSFDSEYSRLTFRASSNCVGYKLETSNTRFYSMIGAKPFVTLKSSDAVNRKVYMAFTDGAANESYSAPNVPFRGNEIALKNTARGEATYVKNDDTARAANFVCNGISYVVGYDRTGYIEKEFVSRQNDSEKQQCVYTWSVEAYEKNSLKNVYVTQTSGTFYDLLPVGATYQNHSVVGYADGVEVPVTVDELRTVTTSDGQERQLLVVHFNTEAHERYRFTYNCIFSWDSILANYPNREIEGRDEAENLVAYETGNDDIGTPESGSTTVHGGLPGYLEGQGLDADKFVWTECKHQVVVTLWAVIGLTKKVAGDSGEISYKDYTSLNHEYKYIYNYTTDADSSATNLVLFDSLETYKVDGTIAPDWQGKLKSVYLGQITTQFPEARPIVYYSETSLVFDKTHNSLTGDGNPYNINDTSVWTEATQYSAAHSDLSAVKSIAIKLDDDFVLGPGETIRVEITMKAPAPDEMPNVDEFNTQHGTNFTEADYWKYISEDNYTTYNDIALHVKLLKKGSPAPTSGDIIHHAFTTLSLRTQGEFMVEKQDLDGNPVRDERLLFRLWSEDGTIEPVERWTDGNGQIRFDWLRPGTYYLQEQDTQNPNYLVNPGVVTVRVDEKGEVEFLLPAGDTAFQTGTVNGLLTLIVQDTPRTHMDLHIVKKNSATQAGLSGVKFHLEGTSDYGNTYDLDLESDSTGSIWVYDLEKCTDDHYYTLTETEALTGFVKSSSEYRVRIDENGIISLSVVVDKENNVEEPVEQIDFDYFVIFNDPLYGFNLMKVDQIDGLPLQGATFILYGPQDNPDAECETRIISTKGADEDTDDGIAEFTDLASGSYVLGEYTDADHPLPANHQINENTYTVHVAKDGTVTIDGLNIEEQTGYYMFPNPRELNARLLIKKVWKDTDPSGRTAPTVHISTKAPDLPDYVATIDYINGNGRQYSADNNSLYKSYGEGRWARYVSCADSKSTPFTENSITYQQQLHRAKSFTRMADVPALTEQTTGVPSAEKPETVTVGSVTWYRIDDGETNCGVYFSLQGDNAYWWSDAAIVYLPEYARGMFYNCSNLQGTLDLSSFRVDKTIEMGFMFYNCGNIQQINTAGWNTSKVTSMQKMFQDCSRLTTLTSNNRGANNWNVGNVKFMTSMFRGCSALTSEQVNALGSWNTSSAVYMESMFRDCSGLANKVTLHWDTGKVTNMSNMFSGCTKLTQLDVHDFKTGSVTNMERMFYNCQKLQSLDLHTDSQEHWNVGNVTNMKDMFYECWELTTLNVNDWDPSNVKTMENMFRQCHKLKYTEGTTLFTIESWQGRTGNVKNFSYMFSLCGSLLGIPGISILDTHSATNMARMFYMSYSITELTLDHVEGTGIWDVSNVTSFFAMFEMASGSGINDRNTALTKLSVRNWDVGSATVFVRMFAFLTGLPYIDLSSWTNVGGGGVFDMASVFNGCVINDSISSPGLKAIILGDWDMSNVRNMGGTFGWCYQLRRIYVGSKWDETFPTDASVISTESHNTDEVITTGTEYGPFFMNSGYRLVGGNGTQYSTERTSNPTGYDSVAYAHTDGWVDGDGTAHKGYFSNLEWAFDENRDNNTWDEGAFGPRPEGVYVSPPTSALSVGNTVQLSERAVVEVKGQNAGDTVTKSVAWTSDNTGVATVNSSGLVTVTGSGEATITATETITVKNAGGDVIKTVVLKGTATISAGNSTNAHRTGEEKLAVSAVRAAAATLQASPIRPADSVLALPATLRESRPDHQTVIYEQDESGSYTGNVEYVSGTDWTTSWSYSNDRYLSGVTTFANDATAEDQNGWCYAFDIYAETPAPGQETVTKTFYVWEDPVPGYELVPVRVKKGTATAQDAMAGDTAHPMEIQVTFDRNGQITNVSYGTKYGDETTQFTHDNLTGIYISGGFVGRTLISGKNVYILKLTNEKKDTTGLVVEKTVTGAEGILTEEDLKSGRFHFRVTLYKDAAMTQVNTDYYGTFGNVLFESGVAEFDLGHGEQMVFNGLPGGAWYKVEETNGDGFTTTYTSQTGQLAANTITTVSVENHKDGVPPQTGDMTITKVVKDQNDAVVTADNLDRTFAFTVTLSGTYETGDENGRRIETNTTDQPISGKFGMVQFQNNVAHVALKAGETLTIPGLPKGVTYTVVEDSASAVGCEVTYANATGQITDGASNVSAVVVTNKVNTATFPLHIRKVVVNSSADTSFTIYVNFTNLVRFGTYHYYRNTDGLMKTFTADGNGSKRLELTIKNGQIITFTDLPEGTTYQVKEAACDFVASYEITAAGAATIVMPSGDNEVMYKDLLTEVETLENGEDVTVTITNTKKVDVQFLKVDEKGTPLPGAHLGLFDYDGEPVYEWVSGTDAHTVTLKPGKYWFVELTAPTGYLCGEDTLVWVDEDGTVYTQEEDEDGRSIFVPVEGVVPIVSMTDNPIRLAVMKVDDQPTPRPVKGATLWIAERPSDGSDPKMEDAIVSWTTGDGPKVFSGELFREDVVYVLCESSTPGDAYKMAENICFIIDQGTGDVWYVEYLANGRMNLTPCDMNEDGIYTIVMVDEIQFTLPLSGGMGTHVFTLGGLLCMTAAVVYYGIGLRRRRERRVK